MIQVYPAESRYAMDLGWLRSRPSFSFGAYYDPDNTSFGVMRVCNDDVVAAGRGFGPHPHSDMEIVTIVLSGAIKHEDNLGNVAVTSAGQIQRMTAGSGMIHAEYNASETEELELLQLWFMPSERGLAPSYETSSYDPKRMNNTLLPVVSRQGSDRAAAIHQDMTIYLSRLEKDRQIIFQQEEGRRVFLFVIEGRLTVDGTPLEPRDTARIEALSKMTIAADEEAFFMLIDLP
ncbi:MULTISPECIES: pirin family protein [Paenibacillus]|uniref:Quercetin 2,3-dioxygenase n=1 Tax=Paenibacillus naphthalenovorans TaxID=162209 RepID=A0A0U2VQ80_9BACL|nr:MULTISPECIES: pirin family protein [Paenibacillus]ALS22934.1 quercetin 2,3-dioxygenase [Paenibacillus naphthalenovorans]SDI45007.1 hypothetical protein SAMN05421868_106187 [Paenibacillus naphthalenovorans]